MATDFTRNEVDSIRNEADFIRNESDSIRKEMDSLRNEVDNIRNEVDYIRNEVNYIRYEVNFIRNEVTRRIYLCFKIKLKQNETSVALICKFDSETKINSSCHLNPDGILMESVQELQGAR